MSSSENCPPGKKQKERISEARKWKVVAEKCRRLKILVVLGHKQDGGSGVHTNPDPRKDSNVAGFDNFDDSARCRTPMTDLWEHVRKTVPEIPAEPPHDCDTLDRGDTRTSIGLVSFFLSKLLSFCQDCEEKFHKWTPFSRGKRLGQKNKDQRGEEGWLPKVVADIISSLELLQQEEGGGNDGTGVKVDFVVEHNLWKVKYALQDWDNVFLQALTSAYDAVILGPDIGYHFKNARNQGNLEKELGPEGEMYPTNGPQYLKVVLGDAVSLFGLFTIPSLPSSHLVENKIQRDMPFIEANLKLPVSIVVVPPERTIFNVIPGLLPDKIERKDSTGETNYTYEVTSVDEDGTTKLLQPVVMKSVGGDCSDEVLIVRLEHGGDRDLILSSPFQYTGYDHEKDYFPWSGLTSVEQYVGDMIEYKWYVAIHMNVKGWSFADDAKKTSIKNIVALPLYCMKCEPIATYDKNDQEVHCQPHWWPHQNRASRLAPISSEEIGMDFRYSSVEKVLGQAVNFFTSMNSSTGCCFRGQLSGVVLRIDLYQLQGVHWKVNEVHVVPKDASYLRIINTETDAEVCYVSIAHDLAKCYTLQIIEMVQKLHF